MDIEIELVGKSNRWVLNQPLIRIGRGAKCEIALPATQYPSIANEHVVLEVSNDRIKLAAGNGAPGDTYLNDRPAAAGSAVHSGDILRLGDGGPELRVRFQERESRSAPVGYEPTRLIRLDEEPVYEPTRLVSIPGRDAEATVQIPSAGNGGKKTVHGAYSTPAAGAPYSPYATPAASVMTGGAASQSAAGTVCGNPRNLEGKLKLMQAILLANLAILVVLLIWVVQLNRQLSQTRDELRELHMQAQTAVSQFTPALDEKLNAFNAQMNGMDAKLRAAEQNMETSMEAKMKVTEDQMVNRMNAEIPAMLDKYINRKLAELKH